MKRFLRHEVTYLAIPYVGGIAACAYFVSPAILFHAAVTTVVVGGFGLSLCLAERKQTRS